MKQSINQMTVRKEEKWCYDAYRHKTPNTLCARQTCEVTRDGAVIWDGPIFSVSGVDDDGGVDINCAKLTSSQRLFPYCQMQ
jgi:hypothetical protein